MAANAPRIYGGTPGSDRVEERRARLIDAAMELIVSGGWRQITIYRLCRQAKLNKRYFYESFSTLDETAEAVVDFVMEGLTEAAFPVAMEGVAAGDSTEEIAQRAVGALVTYTTEDPRRARVLFAEVSATPAAERHRKTLMRGLADQLARYGREFHKAPGRADPRSRVTASFLIGGTAETILAWLDDELEISRAELISDIAALWIDAGDGAAARATASRRA
ncbi:MAG: TetR/AcrR family transcriptional regulator [Solirubrobacteraceae bacterium]|nr:TetR/AcrR family transcriptional regulator [Solirubrobacteraceae bacterium]